MTTDELRARLKTMGPEEIAKFRARFVNPFRLNEAPDPIEAVVGMFAKLDTWERSICHYFGVPTRGEVADRANVEAAHYARRAYQAALVGIVVGLVLGVASLAVSLWK